MRPVANALEQSAKDHGLPLPKLIVEDRVQWWRGSASIASGVLLGKK